MWRPARGRPRSTTGPRWSARPSSRSACGRCRRGRGRPRGSGACGAAWYHVVTPCMAGGSTPSRRAAVTGSAATTTADAASGPSAVHTSSGSTRSTACPYRMVPSGSPAASCRGTSPIPAAGTAMVPRANERQTRSPYRPAVDSSPSSRTPLRNGRRNVSTNCGERPRPCHRPRVVCPAPERAAPRRVASDRGGGRQAQLVRQRADRGPQRGPQSPRVAQRVRDQVAAGLRADPGAGHEGPQVEGRRGRRRGPARGTRC